MAAESSTNTSAEASKGSINPADIPTATQFLCQNLARCPGLKGTFLIDADAAASGLTVAEIYANNS